MLVFATPQAVSTISLDPELVITTPQAIATISLEVVLVF